jgi:hypothetical protein
LTLDKHVGLMMVALLLGTAGAKAAPIFTIPSGLPIGTQYRLVFVTTGSTAATSTDINTYNAFATTQADLIPSLAALGATWTVIGSTPTVGALTNIGTDPGALVYDLEGNEVAASTSAMFTGVNPELLHDIDFTQNGVATAFTEVWTGTNSTGTATATPLGNPLTTTKSTYGNPVGTDVGWVTHGTLVNSSSLPIYVISSELTVPAPEPSSTSLMCLGALWLATRLRRRTRAGRGSI